MGDIIRIMLINPLFQVFLNYYVESWYWLSWPYFWHKKQVETSLRIRNISADNGIPGKWPLMKRCAVHLLYIFATWSMSVRPKLQKLWTCKPYFSLVLVRYLIPHSSRSVNIWLHINISSEAWSQIPWCILEKYQTSKNFIMSMSYHHSKKLPDRAEGARVFNIRPARLYASSMAPRCPFHMIFQVQLLVYSVQRRPLHIWMFHKHIIKTH